MEFWQILSLIGITNLLMVIISFKWDYTEGKLEMIEVMLEMADEEERRGISNDKLYYEENRYTSQLIILWN
jgi:hypothetical protein